MVNIYDSPTRSPRALNLPIGFLIKIIYIYWKQPINYTLIYINIIHKFFKSIIKILLFKKVFYIIKYSRINLPREIQHFLCSRENNATINWEMNLSTFTVKKFFFSSETIKKKVMIKI